MYVYSMCYFTLFLLCKNWSHIILSHCIHDKMIILIYYIYIYMFWKLHPGQNRSHHILVHVSNYNYNWNLNLQSQTRWTLQKSFNYFFFDKYAKIPTARVPVNTQITVWNYRTRQQLRVTTTSIVCDCGCGVAQIQPEKERQQRWVG